MPKNPSFRLMMVRRAVRAAALALVTFLFFGGMVGFAAAGEPASEMPPTFGAPAPFVGDRGEYNFTLVHREGDGFREILPEQPIARFEWLPPRDLLDAVGQARRVNDLRASMNSLYHSKEEGVIGVAPGALDGLKHGTVFSYDAATGELVATGLRADTKDAFEHYLVFLAPGSSSSRNPLCGLRNPLQGQQVDTDQRLRLFYECNIDRRGLGTSEMTFKAAETDRIGERNCIIYARSERIGWVLGDRAEAYVWMCEDVPYPLRIALEDEHIDDRFSVYRLVSWARGTRALAGPDEAPTKANAPPLALTQRRPWGPDEANVDHPFPLSHAYQFARDRPGSSFSNLISQDPATYLAQAEYEEVHQDDGVHRRWWLVATNGLERAAAGVTQTEVAGRRTHSYDHGTDMERARLGAEPYAPPSDLPSRYPTVSSLERLWRAYRIETQEPDGSLLWGFSIRPTMSWCSQRREPDCSVLMTFHVGKQTHTAAAEGSKLQDWSRIQVSYNPKTEQARVTGLNERPQADPTWPGAATLPQPRMHSLSLDIGVWRMPTGAYAVGAGLLAFLVGLAYWSWPAFKSFAGLGFFSRLERPQALAHPARARLVATVEANPGIHFQQLRRELNMAPGTLRHHLAKLVQLGLLSEVRTDGYSCYVLPGRMDHTIARGLPAVKAPGAQTILRTLLKDGPLSLQNLSARAGLDPGTVHYHVQRLNACGLVTSQRAGREVVATAAPHAAHVLDEAS